MTDAQLDLRDPRWNDSQTALDEHDAVTTQLVNIGTHGREGVRPIDRSSQLGNPYRLAEDGGDHGRVESVARFIEMLREQLHDSGSQGLAGDDLRAYLEELRGETLGCWCVPELCHGHVVLYYLDQGSVPEDVEMLRGWGAPSRTAVVETATEQSEETS